MQKKIEWLFFKFQNIFSFFWSSFKNLKPDLKPSNRIFDEGHTIGSHSWSNQDLTLLSDQQILEEMNKTGKIIFDITGAYLKIY